MINPADVDFPYPDAVRFGPADDSLHPPGPSSDWTETTWWSFNVPERGLGGWLYIQIRPNLGVSSGGAFVYGPGRWMVSEQPYYAYFHHLPLPEPMDLRNVKFGNGVSVRVLEPGMRYRVGYQFRDHTEFTADLLFEGLTPPVPHLRGAAPFTGSSHYDQHGRVTGTLQLNGETIDVDCIAVRDRSWGRRPEHVGLGTRRLSYVFGAGSSAEAFLVFTQPPVDDQLAEVENLSSGYLLRSGKLRRLTSAVRSNRRDPATGGVEHITIDGVDSDGRELHVTGDAVSRLALVNASLCVGTIMRFSIDGREGWGEDQDVWPHARFAQMRRAFIGSPDV